MQFDAARVIARTVENVVVLARKSGASRTQSRSAKVNTVSRCMAARIFGIAATITRSAAPFLNSAAASWLMPWREVRSLMPIRTMPLPIGITSPPSTVARPWSWVGSPHQTLTLPAKSGWNL